jgi:hypothetical protein
MRITSFTVSPARDQSSVTVSWTTASAGDCSTVSGHLSESYQNAPPGNYELYHQHAVGFADTGHGDPWPPRRCDGTYNVDYLLAFQYPNGAAVTSVIRTVPFYWAPCIR